MKKTMFILVLMAVVASAMAFANGVGSECTDTDGGEVFDVKGTVTYDGADYVDYCKTEEQLRENYCDDKAKERGYGCAYGCFDGACLSAASCTDADADGYFAEPECLGETDCDDMDATINPGASEVCGDSLDNDCDEDVDEDCSQIPEFTVMGALLGLAGIAVLFMALRR